MFMKLLQFVALMACMFVGLKVRAESTSDWDADKSPTHNTDVSSIIETDGSGGYDAFSGSIRRTVVDMEVPGATGGAGLKWTRSWSNNPSTGVGWSHAYGWNLWGRALGGKSADEPTIEYPDGRSGIPRPGEPEQFIPCNCGIGGSGPVYLYLEDGSVVSFYRWTQDYDAPNQEFQWIDVYQPISVTDRHGNVTQFGVDALPLSNNSPNIIVYRINKIIDPSGRYIDIHYVDGSLNSLVKSVTGSNGDTVTYGYTNGLLTTVTYSDGTSAHYTYKTTYYKVPGSDGNVTWNPTTSLITAQDVRAIGPMQSIQYEYVGTSQTSPANFPGQVKAEHYLAPSPILTTAPSSASGSLVSTFISTSNKHLNVSTYIQTERRGNDPNGPTRNIQFDRQTANLPLVTWKQDYKGVKEFFWYDTNNFLNKFQDRNGKVMTYLNTARAGSPLTITHPGGTSFDGSPFPTSTTTYTYTDNNFPYWVTSIKDDRLNTTTYHRDAHNRITSIDYPPDKNGGVAHEAFVYNDVNDSNGNFLFGQLWKHQRRNGAFEYFQYYDGTHLLFKKFNPTTTNVAQYSGLSSLSAPFTSYTYYPAGHVWQDRIQTVTHPTNNGNNSCLKYAASETFEYDRTYVSGVNTGTACGGRGLVTKITHADSPSATYETVTYDIYGNRLSYTNEDNKETDYQYDDYQRLIKVTDPLSHATTYSPDRTTANINNLTAAAYEHTTQSVWFATDPALVVTRNLYDENFRKTSTAVANNAPTTFHYDAVGNQDYVIDPRGNGAVNAGYTTYSDYDSRNRKIRLQAPLGLTTSYGFDANGNVTIIQHPDGNSETKTYDKLNRVITHTEPVSPGVTKTTQFDYYASGMLFRVTDPNNHITSFGYNEADMKTVMVYPDSANNLSSPTDYELWVYDDMYNIVKRRTANGEFQLFCYDIRNRKSHMEWSNKGSDPAIDAETADFDYDKAGRLWHATNDNSSITRLYDAAGHLTHDTQATAGGTEDVTYTYGGAGRLIDIGGLVGTAKNFDQTIGYDPLGRVQYFGDQWNRPGSVNGNYIEYSYDAASNVTQRSCYLNNTSIVTPHDALNRMSSRSAKVNSSSFSTETYRYDSMSRLQYVDRTEDGSEDAFGYDFSSQLTSATYPARTLTYQYDLAGNRQVVKDNGVPTSYTPNILNEYTTAGTTVTNGNEHQIAAYQNVQYKYINDERLKQATGSGSTYNLAYDALGRCVKRTVNGNATYYYYDGEKPIQETGATLATNIYGLGIDEIVVRFEPSNVYYFYQDHEGSITHVRNNSGLAEQYRYEAFGQPTILSANNTQLSTSAINNRFMFTGREWAPKNLGFYEYRARAYHPGLGRFTTEDPKGFVRNRGLGKEPDKWSLSGHPDEAELNLFRYCENDPLDWTDPMGLDPGDPFPTALAAGQDAVRFTNPTSIRQNQEYGGYLYKLDGQYYAQQPQRIVEREKSATSVSLHGPLPPHSELAGAYHDHGDYSRKEGDRVVRTTKEKDEYNSDHFSGTDKKNLGALAKEQKEFTAVLGTPSGAIKSMDLKAKHPQEQTNGRTDVPDPETKSR
jgi:RHS repeat-associated protein